MDGSGLGEARIGGPAQAEQRLVLLHGWGADAGDLFELGELLGNMLKYTEALL